MNRFKSVDELRTFLQKDRNKSSLSPLRFINVDSMEKWIDVKKLLLSMSKNHVCLSSFCMGEDTTPNIRRFLASIKAAKESICVSPLSEYLRVKPEVAKATIEEILNRDFSGNTDGFLRIYIPMYRMKSILQTVADHDPRRSDCITYLETGEETDYSLTIIQKELQVDIKGNEITGFKQYLQYWEQNPDKPLILHTENAIHFGDNVFFDNVRVIVTAYDLMKYHYNLPLAYKPSDGVQEYWVRLARAVSKESSFDAACCHELLINRYTVKLFDKWNQYDSYHKWLLWMWARTMERSEYLSMCLADSNSPTGFIENVYLKILLVTNCSSYSAFYSERKELLRKLKAVPPAIFWEALESLPAVDRIKVLTDISLREKEEIFKAMAEIDIVQKDEALAILETVYPALWKYLGQSSVITEDISVEFEEYLSQYRWNKATNILDQNFNNKVIELAQKRGENVFTMTSRNQIVNEEYDANTAVIFVDGMGVEYLYYLYATLEPLTKAACNIRCRIGYCNLPTTTAINKDFLIDKQVFCEYIELDQMKHGGSKYPATIMNELAFLDDLKDKIQEAMQNGYSRIILTSDHGTSRMAVLVRKTKFDKVYPAKEHEIYKHGRYCIGTDMADELPTAIEYGDKLIFADYSRFEQKGAPIDETHGGASLEEWLVPVIIVDNSDVRKPKLSVKIKAPQQAAKIDQLTKMVTVVFSLKGYDGDDCTIRIHGKKIVCRKTSDGYNFKYKPDAGEQSVNVSVYVGTDSIGTFAFEIKRSITQNSKFDL